MKIEWLNPEMTEARLTRGRLWWKRVAVVRKVSEQLRGGTWRTFWRFADGDEVSHSISMDLAVASGQVLVAREAAAQEKNWQPARSLPRAEVRRG